MALKYITIPLLSACVLFAAGCRKLEQRRDRRYFAVMGQICKPQHGEGSIFTVSDTVPGSFDRFSVEVLPFEHKVYRIILEKENMPGAVEVFDSVPRDIEKMFNITLEKSSSGGWQCLLPGRRIEFRPAFYLGPQAVALEITDLELEKRAEELKKSPRYREIRKIQKHRETLALIAQAIDGFRLDTGSLPETLAVLYKDPGNIARWNGPYLLHKVDIVCHYRRISGIQYELYTEINGKKISEDSEL